MWQCSPAGMMAILDAPRRESLERKASLAIQRWFQERQLQMNGSQHTLQLEQSFIKYLNRCTTDETGEKIIQK